MEIAAILLDLGDVIMQEETEIKDQERNTQSAELVPGIGELLRALKAQGHKLGVVADTRPQTAWNVLHQHGLYELFDTLAISEQVGAEKPDPRMFLAALDALGLAQADYARVLMVGNNLRRDICGANAVGLISVWFHWNDRYPSEPHDQDRPAYQVHNASELRDLVATLGAIPEP